MFALNKHLAINKFSVIFCFLLFCVNPHTLKYLSIIGVPLSLSVTSSFRFWALGFYDGFSNKKASLIDFIAFKPLLNLHFFIQINQFKNSFIINCINFFYIELNLNLIFGIKFTRYNFIHLLKVFIHSLCGIVLTIFVIGLKNKLASFSSPKRCLI